MDTIYDIVVIGSGPAGLTAAIYALRAGKSVMVLEKSAFGGQVTYSPKIENYPGAGTVSGNELADKMLDQALSLGADVNLDTVTGIAVDADGIKTVIAEDGEYKCRAVIIAVGVKHRLLGVPGEAEMLGEGISFCAVCDGAFYKDKTVSVIGGGNSALQEAVLLSETSSHVTVVQNLDYFTGEAKLVETLRSKANVSFVMGTVVKEVLSENGELKGIRLAKAESGEERVLNCDGVFVAIGLVPANKIFSELCELNEWGYFDTDESCVTKTPGVFVAGDCRSKRIRQITTATSDGAVAALAACRYLEG